MGLPSVSFHTAPGAIWLLCVATGAFVFAAAMSDAGIAVAASATNAFKNFIDNLFPIVNGTLV